MDNFTKAELAEALRAIASMISKCEKVQKKLDQGTPQSSLIRNRLKALYVASSLIKKSLRKKN
jgi:hypothetical protein